MSLTEFLLARLAEDEAVARAAIGGQYTISTTWANNSLGVHAHIQRWSSSRVLAECEAKRRIVERAEHAASAQAHGVVNPASIASEIAWFDCLRLLALPYADYPDFRDEWRPDPVNAE